MFGGLSGGSAANTVNEESDLASIAAAMTREEVHRSIHAGMERNENAETKSSTSGG